MEKNIYTFEEILMALRIEFLKHQKLLVELKKYLSIEDEKVKDFFFDSYYKMMYYDKSVRDKQLLFIMEERLNLLKNFKEKLSALMYGDYEMVNKLFYNVNSDNSGHFGFVLDTKGVAVNINPTINITDQKGFDELVNEILNSDVMNLIEQQVKQPMIDNWNLRIYNRMIYLGNGSRCVSYDPKYDTVKFSGIDYRDDAISMIKSPIPEFYINDDVKAMINKNLQEGNIEINEYKFNKKWTTFNVEDKEKGLRLVKKK